MCLVTRALELKFYFGRDCEILLALSHKSILFLYRRYFAPACNSTLFRKSIKIIEML